MGVQGRRDNLELATFYELGLLLGKKGQQALMTLIKFSDNGKLSRARPIYCLFKIFTVQTNFHEAQ